MTILHLLAADLADVDIVFHAFDESGVAVAEDARAMGASAYRWRRECCRVLGRGGEPLS